MSRAGRRIRLEALAARRPAPGRWPTAGHTALGRTDARENLVHHQAEGVDVALHRDARRRCAAPAPYRLACLQITPAPLMPPGVAMPKSINWGRPARFTMMFAGFKSRWSTPRACTAPSPGADLSDQLNPFGFRESAALFQRRSEVLAVDVFHGEEQVPVDVADVVHATDIGMGDLPRDADFAVKLREASGITRERGRQELQRHRLRPAAGQRPDRRPPCRRGRAA